MLALIDADIILYSVGFASENRQYEVCDSKGVLVKTFKYAKDANSFMEQSDRSDLTRHKITYPVEHFIWKGNANTLIRNIMSRSGCNSCELYLTGKGNFRETIYPAYKKNRDASHKPLMYKEFKQWLIDRHDAVLVEGREADER